MTDFMPDLLLFRGALRDLLRPRRLLSAAPLILLPAALALLWRLASRPERPFDPRIAYSVLSGTLVFGFVLVILAVIFGTGVLAQELEQRTIVYLLTRPIHRGRVLFAKFLGALVGIVATISLAVVLLALATYGLSDWHMVARDLAVLPLGAAAYSGLFLLLATCLNRPLIYGLGFAFGWESWVPIMPGAFGKWSIMTYVRVLAPHNREEDDMPSLATFLNILSPHPVSVEQARITLSLVAMLTLAVALFAFSRREYAPREDAE